MSGRQRRAISGRTVMISGAGSGIGRSLARRLSAAGSPVALVDIDGRGLAPTAESLSGPVLSKVVDVRDAAAQVDFAAQVREWMPVPLGAVFNNAGESRILVRAGRPAVRRARPDRADPLLRRHRDGGAAVAGSSAGGVVGVLQRGGAQHAGVAAAHQAGSLRVARDAALERHRAQFVMGALGRSHRQGSCYDAGAVAPRRGRGNPGSCAARARPSGLRVAFAPATPPIERISAARGRRLR